MTSGILIWNNAQIDKAAVPENAAATAVAYRALPARSDEAEIPPTPHVTSHSLD